MSLPLVSEADLLFSQCTLFACQAGGFSLSRWHGVKPVQLCPFVKRDVTMTSLSQAQLTPFVET